MNDLQSKLDAEYQGGTPASEVLSFLVKDWMGVIATALVGALLGLGSWFLFGSYQATIILRSSGSLDFSDIKTLQAGLPGLAAEILQKNQVQKVNVGLYSSMSTPDFWKKAVIPVYSVTNAEIKGLGVGGEGIKGEFVSLVIHSSSESSESATYNIVFITQFFHEGLAYLAIRKLFFTQEADSLKAQSSINSGLSNATIELRHLKARQKSLEELGKRFPVESLTYVQALEVKDSAAKLAEVILRLSSSKSKIIHQSLPSDDPRQRQPHLALAKSRLDWEPRVNLEDGLKETIAYFRKAFLHV